MTGMAEALVSVVIPTYNRRRCVGRAVDSVLRQDCGPVELIVVDDASLDGTAGWLAARYPGLKVIRQATNRGVAAARNAGLAASRGRFIAFLDDDDWWDDSFLSNHMRVLSGRPDAVVSYCDFTSVAPDGGSMSAGRSRDLGPEPVKDFLMGNPIPSMTLVVARREATVRAGGFRAEFEMCEDREFYLRLLPLGTFVHEPKTLAHKTRSLDSMTVDRRKWAVWTQKLLDDFFSREESRPYRHLENPARAVWQTRLAAGCLRQAGQRLLGLSLVASALRYDAWGCARYIMQGAVRRMMREIRSE